LLEKHLKPISLSNISNTYLVSFAQHSQQLLSFTPIDYTIAESFFSNNINKYTSAKGGKNANTNPIIAAVRAFSVLFLPSR
jgi:hypothetical protein